MVDSLPANVPPFRFQPERIFWVDTDFDQVVSYGQLFFDLANTIKNRLPPGDVSVYSGLVEWLAAIVSGQPKLILPSDSQGNMKAELQWRVQTSDCIEPLEQLSCGEMALSQWQSMILNSPTRVLLTTSGSTGMQQQFWHSLASLTRGVRMDSKHRQDVWGLAYPLNHLAGLQVLFQALLNGNRLIRLYGQSIDLIHQNLADQQVSHLSCTPTFLRLLLSSNHVHSSLMRLTNGGERYDSQLDAHIVRMFPNAERRNIYAATETGNLFSSDNEQFKVPDTMKNLLKIMDGQLWLHRSLRQPQVEETKESESKEKETKQLEKNQTEHLKVSPAASTSEFASTPDPATEFWPTGDRVEIVIEEPLTIRFLSRTSEGFNVAGNRVDPLPLEQVARQHPLVVDAKFYGVPNSVTENLVGCDLMIDPQGSQNWDEPTFRQWLQSQLERHELPRFIRLVNQMPMNRTTKLDRR